MGTQGAEVKDGDNRRPGSPDSSIASRQSELMPVGAEPCTCSRADDRENANVPHDPSSPSNAHVLPRSPTPAHAGVEERQAILVAALPHMEGSGAKE